MEQTTTPLSLTTDQLAVIEAPLGTRIFLEGPAGSGKTTVGVERTLELMVRGVRGDSILLLLPQRTLGGPYLQALRHPGVVAGGMVSLLTVGGLAQRMVDLFWPLVAEQAGFGRPDELPTFLTLETAQYYMAHLIRPLLDEGLFDSVTLDRNRLYSQIIDNLNKAAVVGFPYTEIGERLKAAWTGEPGQLRIYDDVQVGGNRFREYCLAHNLLDFSLQLEVFIQHLWPTPLCRDYLRRTYHHLIFDNLEEDTPVAHDLLRDWLPDFASALLIYDQQAGFRTFLGADPQSAYALKDLCEQQVFLDTSFVTSTHVKALGSSLAFSLNPSIPPQPAENDLEENSGEPRAALEFEHHRYYPEMLDWVAERITHLINDEKVSAGQIVVLAPYLSDALRFSLASRLQANQIPVRSHRPSRSLREEPAAQCMLTLSAIAHPQWGLVPTKFDLAYALVQAIAEMDLVRAQILTDFIYRVRNAVPVLASFEEIPSQTQARITYKLGERYENLRFWLTERSQDSQVEFDHFLSRLFGELLSQPGYGFHNDYNAGEVAANLIESVQKFRWVAGSTLAEEDQPLGKEYLEMVEDGVIAAQYIRSWQLQADEAVLLAPAYTFLMSNRPVDYQFWLDVGSRGWFERLYQPLTHPYVLSRNWPKNKFWTDYDEVATNQETLYRLALGLVRRCRWMVFLGLSELNEQGFEERGPLLKAFQRVLRETAQES